MENHSPQPGDHCRSATSMMRWVFAILFVAIPTVAVRAQPLRIATYNLNYANRSGDAVLSAIAEADADILCLQETTRNSERFLRRKLAGTYPEFHAAGHKGKHFAERFVIASKVKLRDVVFVPPRHGPFGFHHAIISFEGIDIQIVNVHLLPFVVPKNSTFADAMKAGIATETVHAAEIAAILNVAKGDKPAIVAGDFNSLSTFSAPVALIDSGFTDSYASVHENADTHPTWQWPTRQMPLRLRIDYIFHSKHFRTIDSAIVRREGSDHSLVVTTVEIAEQAVQPEPRAGRL
jgi:endonuclease/exonuclease/phosphatase (EEP) superfamily protein YafD